MWVVRAAIASGGHWTVPHEAVCRASNLRQINQLVKIVIEHLDWKHQRSARNLLPASDSETLKNCVENENNFVLQLGDKKFIVL